MSAKRTKEEVVALIQSLGFAPQIQAGTNGLRITVPDGTVTAIVRRAPATRTKTSNSGTR